MMDLFRNYPPIYQFKIATSLFDNLALMDSNEGIVGNSMRMILTFSKLYENFFIQLIDSYFFYELKNPDEIAQFIILLDSFVSFSTRHNDVLVDLPVELSFINWEKVSLDLWIKDILILWWKLNNENSFLQ